MGSICSKCGKPAVGRFLCNSHYQTAWKAGTIKKHKLPYRLSLKERIMAKVKKTSAGCWEWQGQTRFDGYGLIWYKGKAERAHRIAYMVLKGKLPKLPLVLCHTCDNRKCVNPAHIFLGTRGDNIRDAASKWRLRINDLHHATKLSVDDVKYIRSATERSCADIARMFGVNPSTVSDIRRGASRKYI